MNAKLSIQLESFQGEFNFSKNIAESISIKIGCMGLPEKSVYSICFNLDSDDTDFNIYTTEVFVSENLTMLRAFIESYIDTFEFLGNMRCYFQQWSSYEEAYEMALIVREGNPLHSVDTSSNIALS